MSELLVECEGVIGLIGLTNVTEVGRFLGMVNQLGKFSPNFAERTKPLSDLLCTKKHWYWGPDQKRAFLELKEELCSSETLTLFDPMKPSKVSADASSYGFGGVLRQKHSDDDWRPVCYISQSMTETEQHYTQIKKQALALTWACERLSQYLLGSRFILETDHKPLIPLLSTKDLEEIPIRVQRFRLRMMTYDYDVVHVPGKELNTADFLSRLPLPETESDNLQDEVQAYIDLIFEHLPATRDGRYCKNY